MGEQSGAFTGKVNNRASSGKTTDEIVHQWNQAHSEDMILLDFYGCQADGEPARTAIEEWLSSFQKASEFDISCNGNYNLFQ